MKKLKLNLERLNNVEVLTREELKTVLGGLTGSGCIGPGGLCNEVIGGCCAGLSCSGGVCMPNPCASGPCGVEIGGVRTNGTCGVQTSGECGCITAQGVYIPIGGSTCNA